MATWTNITDSALEPGKPVRSVDGLALRDNPIAITEGASGAPKIQNAAMDDDTVDDRLLTGTATTVGRNWVLARTALAEAGALGTYAFAESTLSSGHGFGDTISGSALRPTNVGLNNSAVALSGTWRCMGHVTISPAEAQSATLWLRIS